MIEVERQTVARPAEAPYRILSRIFEPGEPFPIVVHAFNGRTLAQAEGFFRAHMKSDAFLRECSTKGTYAGKVKCREEHIAERWDGTAWRRA